MIELWLALRVWVKLRSNYERALFTFTGSLPPMTKSEILKFRGICGRDHFMGGFSVQKYYFRGPVVENVSLGYFKGKWIMKNETYLEIVSRQDAARPSKLSWLCLYATVSRNFVKAEFRGGRKAYWISLLDGRKSVNLSTQEIVKNVSKLFQYLLNFPKTKKVCARCRFCPDGLE